MTEEKIMHRRRTYSGDYYTSTEELWKSYWLAVENDNWDYVMFLEECHNPDFQYTPET